jgi:hypothetical protein
MISSGKREGVNRRPKPRQSEKEAVMNENRLKGFNAEVCAANLLLRDLYGALNGQDLLSLAKVCSSYLDLYLDREACRRKVVLFKWFDENLSQIAPFLREHIVVENGNEQIGPPAVIDKLREATRKSGIDV